jgi:hypothetical protein
METKLTLKLDQAIIQSAKQYAEEHNRSVSKLVEDYFRNLIVNIKDKTHYSPIVEELSGVITPDDINNSDYTSYLERKYE